MTIEQREAIDRLNKDKNKPLACGDITTCFIDDLDTVLSLIKENSAEIQQKNTELAEKSAELEKKDKQIDLMASYIASLDIEEDICVKTGRLNECDSMALGECENCIKQYFAKLAKKGE